MFAKVKTELPKTQKLCVMLKLKGQHWIICFKQSPKLSKLWVMHLCEMYYYFMQGSFLREGLKDNCFWFRYFTVPLIEESLHSLFKMVPFCCVRLILSQSAEVYHLFDVLLSQLREPFGVLWHYQNIAILVWDILFLNIWFIVSLDIPFYFTYKSKKYYILSCSMSWLYWMQRDNKSDCM